jgi:hypothetical protein
MKLDLYQEIVLVYDVPEAQLKQGDVATLIDFVPHPYGGEAGAVLEIFNALGESIRVATVPTSAVESLRSDHVPAVRQLEQKA